MAQMISFIKVFRQNDLLTFLLSELVTPPSHFNSEVTYISTLCNVAIGGGTTTTEQDSK